MNIEDIRSYCLSLPNVTEDVPFGKFGSDDVAFRIGDRIFAFLLVDDSRMVVLKSDPDKAIDLRDRYAGAVEPAFHWNKKHWNQVHYDSPLLSAKVIADMIDDSFRLVVDKLPRKLRVQLSVDNLPDAALGSHNL